MINLNIMGGMGNQMFQYAFARSLSEKCGDKNIVINPYFLALIRMSVSRKALRTANSLIHFQLNDNVKIARGISGSLKAFNNYVYYVYNTFCTRTSPELFEKRSERGKYLQTTHDAGKVFTDYSTGRYRKTITGYFCSDKWWLPGMGKLLRAEFTVKEKPSESNKKMIEKISLCNSVCVHIRRGDYLLPQNSYLNICDEKYYHLGMDYIAQHTENPVFFIFTNSSGDMKWVRENYRFDYPVNYVDLNNPDYEELRLMYNCKHFVICNSTFSWWGSYLAENKNKIVAAPSRWSNVCNNGNPPCDVLGENIYRDDMIKIPIGLDAKT